MHVHVARSSGSVWATRSPRRSKGPGSDGAVINQIGGIRAQAKAGARSVRQLILGNAT